MAARAFKNQLTNTTRAAEMLKANIGVSHEGLASPAISENVRCGCSKTESNLEKSNRRAGTEGVDSVIFFYLYEEIMEKILSCFP